MTTGSGSGHRPWTPATRAASRWTPSARWIYAAATLLVLAALYPVVYTALSGDDVVTRYSTIGNAVVTHESFWSRVFGQFSPLIFYGRFMPLTSVLGGLMDYVLTDRVLYKIVIVLTSFAAVALLWRVLRAMGFRSTWTPAIIAVAFALSIQLRVGYDPLQAEECQQQVGMILLFGGLLAYLRWLRGSDLRWLLLAVLSAAACATLYEGNVPLLLAFGCMHLIADPQRTRTWRSLLPILAVLIADTAVIVYVHETATATANGYNASLSVFDIGQSIMRQAAAGVPGIYFASGAANSDQPGDFYGSPTHAELLAAAWRAALLGLLFLGSLRLVRRDTNSGGTSTAPAPAPTLPLGSAAALGLVLIVGPTLFVAVAQKDQDTAFIGLGDGYLASFACTLGFSTLAVAAWEAWGRKLIASRWVAAAVGCLVVVLGFINAYGNERVVAIQWPIVKQTDILNSGVTAGALDGVSTHTTIFADGRDFGGNLYPGYGNPDSVFDYYGDAGNLDYLVYMQIHRRYDIRPLTSAPDPTCGPAGSFPVEQTCQEVSKRVAIIVPRATQDGGAVIVANGIPEQGLNSIPPATITVTATGDAATGSEPDLSGSTASGQPWTASSVHWKRRALPNGWVQYFARIQRATGPLPWSLNIAGAPYGLGVDFPTPAQQARMFGTKHLLP